MKKDSVILKLSLLAGAIYFFLIAAAHLSGLKIPGLYIYFDIPSYPYQDNIVAFLALGWSIFFYTAFTDVLKNIALIKAILIAGAAAIIVLSIINFKTDFQLLNSNVDINIIWLEVFILFIYWLWLVVFYFRLKKNSDQNEYFNNDFT
ncbi:MAG: hypothetical protein MUE64_09200 [Ignavibacteriaceae bacterium]|jgi:hypothetical protein|nr:hypothetical protein [Ignavibacteriaceae bacterium]MCU0407121.1 hypothetical protein [Ignavibacteriaceae bacterium]